MIIKELSFPVFSKIFSKIFKEHDGMIIGIGFTIHGTVDVLLTSDVTWYVSKNTESGIVTVWGVGSDERTHTFTLNSDDFEEITIC